LNTGSYSELADSFRSMQGYKDSGSLADECHELVLNTKYELLIKEKNNAKTADAFKSLSYKFFAIQSYKNSKALAAECEELALKTRYDSLINEKNNAKTANEYENLAKNFNELKDYRNSKALADECRELVLNTKYEHLVQEKENAKTENDYQKLAEQFHSLNEYKDSGEQAKDCEYTYHLLKSRREEQERIRAEEEEKKRIEDAIKEKERWKQNGIVFISVIAFICVFSLIISISQIRHYEAISASNDKALQSSSIPVPTPAPKPPEQPQVSDNSTQIVDQYNYEEPDEPEEPIIQREPQTEVAEAQEPAEPQNGTISDESTAYMDLYNYFSTFIQAINETDANIVEAVTSEHRERISRIILSDGNQSQNFDFYEMRINLDSMSHDTSQDEIILDARFLYRYRPRDSEDSWIDGANVMTCELIQDDSGRWLVNNTIEQIEQEDALWAIEPSNENILVITRDDHEEILHLQ
jgi:hypothetical protein